ncbi:MAG: hypothetical protein ABI779_07625 [Acidobacteriota bacterium]
MDRFDISVTNGATESLRPILANFEEVTKVMATHSATTILWAPPADPGQLLNHYLDVLWWVHVSKFHELCGALIGAVNRGEFIVFGLIGRSLIEHAAVMRYYFKQRLQPTIDEAVSTGGVSPGQIELVVTELDRFLRGGRFNWEAFFEGNFDALHAAAPAVGPQQQVNIKTCVQQWAKETPSVTILYASQ